MGDARTEVHDIASRRGFDRSDEVRVTQDAPKANRHSAHRLGAYVLPGGVADPSRVVEQARAIEASGLGTVWIGERYDTKDLPSLAGALTQTTVSVRIGAAVTHTQLRHPMVLASMGQTLQALESARRAVTISPSRGPGPAESPARRTEPTWAWSAI